jgi:hypothetical protein
VSALSIASSIDRPSRKRRSSELMETAWDPFMMPYTTEIPLDISASDETRHHLGLPEAASAIKCTSYSIYHSEQLSRAQLLH